MSSRQPPPPLSLVDESLSELAIEEKCVVAQYRTTALQKDLFQAHVNENPRDSIPIEWVIDIADESNGWFYGTAYHFNDATQMLHVMVPDKENPTFDGQVLLDHRTVHLIECVDGKSEALFNKIIRDSVSKVKWDVEWFEEDETTVTATPAGEQVPGSWVASSARYYIRIANQLLVEDKETGQDTRGFVILTADMNLKLLACHKNKGVDDFHRLILEGSVQSSPEAVTAAKEFMQNGGITPGKSSSKKTRHDTERDPSTGDIPMRKLTEMSRNLKDAISELLEEREKLKTTKKDMASVFEEFLKDGNLAGGMQLMTFFSNIEERSSSDFDKEDDKAEIAGDDAWYFAKKIDGALSRRMSNAEV